MCRHAEKVTCARELTRKKKNRDNCQTCTCIAFIVITHGVTECSAMIKARVAARIYKQTGARMISDLIRSRPARNVSITFEEGDCGPQCTPSDILASACRTTRSARSIESLLSEMEQAEATRSSDSIAFVQEIEYGTLIAVVLRVAGFEVHLYDTSNANRFECKHGPVLVPVDPDRLRLIRRLVPPGQTAETDWCIDGIIHMILFQISCLRAAEALGVHFHVARRAADDPWFVHKQREFPQSLYIDASAHETRSNGMVVYLDDSSGEVRALLPIGQGSRRGLLDAADGLAYGQIGRVLEVELVTWSHACACGFPRLVVQMCLCFDKLEDRAGTPPVHLDQLRILLRVAFGYDGADISLAPRYHAAFHRSEDIDVDGVLSRLKHAEISPPSLSTDHHQISEQLSVHAKNLDVMSPLDVIRVGGKYFQNRIESSTLLSPRWICTGDYPVEQRGPTVHFKAPTLQRILEVASSASYTSYRGVRKSFQRWRAEAFIEKIARIRA